MERQRVQDRWVGAAAAVVVLLLALVPAAAVLLWWASEPVTGGAAPPAASPGASPSAPSTAAEPGRASGAPTDLAEGETWLGDLVLDADAVVTPGSQLRDVRAVGQDVRSGPAGLEVGTLAVDATVPFDVVAEQIGGGATVSAAGASGAAVARTVEVAGRRFSVVATGTVDVVAGELVFEPRSIDVGGPDALSQATAAAARRLVTIERRVEGLPEGLVLQDVTVQDDGFRAHLEGDDVRLVR